MKDELILQDSESNLAPLLIRKCPINRRYFLKRRPNSIILRAPNLPFWEQPTFDFLESLGAVF